MTASYEFVRSNEVGRLEPTRARRGMPDGVHPVFTARVAPDVAAVGEGVGGGGGGGGYT